jgi:hypothetical protein
MEQGWSKYIEDGILIGVTIFKIKASNPTEKAREDCRPARIIAF